MQCLCRPIHYLSYCMRGTAEGPIHQKVTGLSSRSLLWRMMIYCSFHESIVTSWDKISRMSQFFHMELNIPVFRPHSELQIREN